MGALLDQPGSSSRHSSHLALILKNIIFNFMASDDSKVISQRRNYFIRIDILGLWLKNTCSEGIRLINGNESMKYDDNDWRLEDYQSISE